MRVCHRYTVLVSQCLLAVIRWKWKLSHVTLSARSHLMIAVIDPDLITTDQYSPSLSLIPTTMVSVVPRGTMPATGSAQGPLPCCISIQQSTLSPEIWSVFRICSQRQKTLIDFYWHIFVWIFTIKTPKSFVSLLILTFIVFLSTSSVKNVKPL